MKKITLLAALLTTSMLTACPNADKTGGNNNTNTDDITYTATFKNYDGTQFGEVQTLKDGETPTVPSEVPSRDEDENFTYTFDKWTPEVGPIHQDTVYTATYTSVAKEKKFNKSALKASYVELMTALLNEEYTTIDSKEWYEEDKMYSTGVLWGMDTDTTIRSATEEARDIIKNISGYELVKDVYSFKWENDDSDGFEVDFKKGNEISINIGSSLEQNRVYIYVELFLNDGYTLVDDLPPEGKQTKEITFYNGGFKGSLDTKSIDDFKTWLNGTDGDLFESVVLAKGTYAQLNEFDDIDGKFTTMCLGSGSKGCDLTFNFKYVVTSIELVASPYYKYDSYNKIYRGDTGSALYSGETLLKDFSRTDTNAKPENETISLEFDEKHEVKSFNLSILDSVVNCH